MVFYLAVHAMVMQGHLSVLAFHPFDESALKRLDCALNVELLGSLGHSSTVFITVSHHPSSRQFLSAPT
uniref:hypothetical protein n=1 Tax=Vibrio sp. 04Ya108 TaxID=864336 RepID=UPI00159ECDE9|nr:hypothetical protein [Vibrio sp. 04Ya108]